MLPSDMTFMRLFCGDADPSRQASTFLVFDQAVWYYKNNRSCHKCWISEILYCKAFQSPWHEFVLLLVRHPERDGTFGVLRVERVAGERLFTAAASLAQSRPFPDSSTSTQLLGDSTAHLNPRHNGSTAHNARRRLPTFTAVDGVCIMNHESDTQDYEVLARIPLSDNSIRLAHVLAAGQVVSNSQRRYRLIKAQCYWFALVFCRLLVGEERWPAVKDDIRRGRARGSLRSRLVGMMTIAGPRKVDGTARKLQQQYDDELKRVDALLPDAEVVNAAQQAEARRQEAEEQRRVAEERLEEEEQRTRAAEARSAAKDQEIAVLTKALAVVTGTNVAMSHDGTNSGTLSEEEREDDDRAAIESRPSGISGGGVSGSSPLDSQRTLRDLTNGLPVVWGVCLPHTPSSSRLLARSPSPRRRSRTNSRVPTRRASQCNP